VRGTPLDVVGWARQRREERALADEYEALVGGALGARPYDETVDLAASVQAIRGYEDIKSEAIAQWRRDVAAR